MRSSGLGQLAYDKGMRVLAATQAETTAAEVNFQDGELKLEQGLLTYALVEMGLVEGRANVNGDAVILVQEWLEYGAAGVPSRFDIGTNVPASAPEMRSNVLADSDKAQMCARNGSCIVRPA